jgi:hypothetical protein
MIEGPLVWTCSQNNHKGNTFKNQLEFIDGQVGLAFVKIKPEVEKVKFEEFKQIEN